MQYESLRINLPIPPSLSGTLGLIIILVGGIIEGEILSNNYFLKNNPSTAPDDIAMPMIARNLQACPHKSISLSGLIHIKL
jgi:hypothetical protein